MILSCPFCGSSPTLVYRKTFKEYFVVCDTNECQAIVGRSWGNNKFCALTKEVAIQRWNAQFERKEYDLQSREI